MLTFVVLPLFTLALMMNWLFVISIPMAKMISKIIRICIDKEPENIQVVLEYSNASAFDVLFWTHKCTCLPYSSNEVSAVNYFYFKYKVLGMNIVFFNLMPVVLVRIAMVIAIRVTERRFLPIIVRIHMTFESNSDFR